MQRPFDEAGEIASQGQGDRHVPQGGNDERACQTRLRQARLPKAGRRRGAVAARGRCACRHCVSDQDRHDRLSLPGGRSHRHRNPAIGRPPERRLGPARHRRQSARRRRQSRGRPGRPCHAGRVYVARHVVRGVDHFQRGEAEPGLRSGRRPRSGSADRRHGAVVSREAERALQQHAGIHRLREEESRQDQHGQHRHRLGASPWPAADQHGHRHHDRARSLQGRVDADGPHGRQHRRRLLVAPFHGGTREGRQAQASRRRRRSPVPALSRRSRRLPNPG